MSKSTRSGPTGLRLNLIADEKVTFDRKGEDVLVGQHARDHNGEYVFVLWQYLDSNAFGMDVDVWEEVDPTVQYVYVVDIDTKDLYKFTHDAFAEADTRVRSGDKQKAVQRWDFTDFWESCADNVLLGFYD